MKPFILGIIPARSGSKGVPGKNIRLLAGKPLITYSIEAANSSKSLSDYIVSTDGEEIAAVARAADAPVPFVRPGSLATDDSFTIDTVIHAVAWYEEERNQEVDIVVLLQPTSPFRTAEDIDAAIRLFTNSQAESLISCYDAGHVHPQIMYTLAGARLQPLLQNDAKQVRRQELSTVYVRNGAIYIATRRMVMDVKKMYDEAPAAYLMPRDRSLNIDEPHDLELAEYMVRRGKA